MAARGSIYIDTAANHCVSDSPISDPKTLVIQASG
jgi:hypothetical protein